MRSRGDRIGRGDIRGLLLSGLLDGPTHGYGLMRRLADASGGVWTPSPGSVYPTLQMFEDEGLVSSSAESGRKTYTLTAAGRREAEVAARAKKPWEESGLPAGRYPLRDLTAGVHVAAKQVGTEGTPEQIEKAIQLMRSTRQQLYRLLAED